VIGVWVIIVTTRERKRRHRLTHPRCRLRAAASGLGHQRGDSQISLCWTLLPAWRCCSVTRARPNRKASQNRQHQELHRTGHHLARAGSAGRQRARLARRGGQRIIAAARGERILSKPRRPISEASFSLLAREARTARQV
jgi:hypothetical protein